MTLLVKSGSRWSQISIDTDKDMVGKGLSNLKELAAGMLHGDLIVKGPGGVLIRVPPGIANTVWTSNGPGAVPSWQPGGTFYNRFFPANISLLGPSVLIKSPDKTAMKNAPLSSSYVTKYTDSPGSNVKRLTPAITTSKSTAVVSPDHRNIRCSGCYRQ
jgi:hypothetical protein